MSDVASISRVADSPFVSVHGFVADGGFVRANTFVAENGFVSWNWPVAPSDVARISFEAGS
jgi:hypothetical protein